jgi:AraC-like DNA-binding protein/ligand-binding sensor protein
MFPSPAPPNPGSIEPSTSLISRFLDEISQDGPARISFEDLTGVTLDHPDVRIPYHYRIHTCDFCMYAKSDINGHQACIRNKMAANRRAIRFREKFSGQCHLGLTDLIQPLVYRESVLGVFYYGSFVLAGTEERGRARILRYCRRRGIDPAGHLRAFEAAARVSVEMLPRLWAKLDLVVDISTTIITALGLPTERYRTRQGAQFATWNRAMSSLVRNVVTYINHNYSTELRVIAIARAFGCNPDYLSRAFKKTTGLGLVDCIHHVRIDHAKRLLMADRFSAGEVGFMVGFQDQSHFGKIFRSLTGVTPHEFRRSMRLAQTEPKAFSTFEYSNVHPFNPRFAEALVEQKKLIM